MAISKITQKQLDELDAFFKKAELPETAKLESGVTVKDVPKFIESHFEMLKTNYQNPNFGSFYTRLLRLREIITEAKQSKGTDK